MKPVVLFVTLFFSASGLLAQDYYRNWTVQNETKKDKIALVMANNTYESSGSLEQPIASARKLEASLKSQGFDVLVGRDMNRMRMVSIISDFSEKFRQYEFAMIFYMGHGFQIDGNNYLIPTDANPRSKEDVEVHAINVDYVLKKINDPNTPKVIVLDACRDNPFVKNWTSSERSGSDNGFGDVSAPRNAEIFFTTQKASKVRDDNPYIDYFMKEMESGGCLEDIVRNVSKQIYNYNPDQIPAKYGQLFDKICFGNSPNPNPTPNPNVNVDSDNDGIIDRYDDCPYKYGVSSNNGCPELTYSEETIKEWYNSAKDYYNDKNYQSAYTWFVRAGDQGHKMSQFYLGWMYENAFGVDKDYRKATYWYTLAAEQNISGAQNNLGILYETGKGVEEDDEMAVFWYKKSANGGSANGMVNLGDMYRKGEGVGQDYFEAMNWFRKAADKELPLGYYKVGYMYDYGYGVTKNHYTANDWYQKGADEGHARSMWRLGENYKAGNGFRKDTYMAEYWFQKACDDGHQASCDALKEL